VKDFNTEVFHLSVQNMSVQTSTRLDGEGCRCRKGSIKGYVIYHLEGYVIKYYVMYFRDGYVMYFIKMYVRVMFLSHK